jgi:LruC domain-containing protein
MRWLFGFLVVFTHAGLAHAIESVRLTDVIKANGTGSVDLFKDVDASALEAFRVDGGAALRIAVDVNEAANGSEKSTSQAVTIDTLTLRVTVGGTEHVFTEYSTATQALLARAGTTVRTPYYTVIGDSGSNRITSNAVQDRFDETIMIPVDLDLSQASAATLQIVLLDVNSTLGDPEDFYDYSNGFEDLALLNSTDHEFLSALAPGTDEAPAVVLTDPPPEGESVVGWLNYPAAGEFYAVGFEDSFPNAGDYDFNDMVAAYRVDFGLATIDEVSVIAGSAFPVARGAGYSHDFRLHISVLGGATGTIEVTRTQPLGLPMTEIFPFNGDVDVAIFSDTRTSFPSPDGFAFTNTEPGSPFVQGERVDFTVRFATPIALAELQNAPFDPYIVVQETNYEVHLIGNMATASSRNVSESIDGFRDGRGFPFAMLTPLNWRFPWERLDLGGAYPRLSNYVTSLETSDVDWYAYPEQTKVRSYGRNSWEW